jgi:hypothetical protein
VTVAYVILLSMLGIAAVFAVFEIYTAFKDGPYEQAEKRRKANERFKEIVNDRETQDE